MIIASWTEIPQRPPKALPGSWVFPSDPQRSALHRRHSEILRPLSATYVFPDAERQGLAEHPGGDSALPGTSNITKRLLRSNPALILPEQPRIHSLPLLRSFESERGVSMLLSGLLARTSRMPRACLRGAFSAERIVGRSSASRRNRKRPGPFFSPMQRVSPVRHLRSRREGAAEQEEGRPVIPFL